MADKDHPGRPIVPFCNGGAIAHSQIGSKEEPMSEYTDRIDQLDRQVEVGFSSALQEDWERLIAEANEIAGQGTPQAQRVLARAYLGKANFVRDCKGTYTECLELYHHSLETDAGLAEAYLERAEVFARRGEEDQAAADRGHALEIHAQDLRENPSDAEALYSRARLYESMNDELQAAAELDRAIEALSHRIMNDPNDPNAYTWRARALELRGDLARSIEQERDPDLDYQELTAIEREFQKRALADLTEPASGLRLEDFQTRVQRAGLYHRLEEHDEALSEVQEIISLDARHRGAYHILISAVTQKNQGWDALIAVLTDLTNQTPSEPEFVKLRALSYMARGRSLDQEDPTSALTDYDLALADLNRAVSLDPLDADAVSRRARAYAERAEKSGLHFDWRRAIADITRVLQLDPISPTSELGERARYHENTAQSAEALADLSQALALNPSADLFRRRGDVHRKLGKSEQAERDYESALLDTACEWYDKKEVFRTLVHWAIEEQDYERILAHLERYFSEPNRGSTRDDDRLVYWDTFQAVEEKAGLAQRSELAKRIVNEASAPALVVHAVQGLGNLTDEEKREVVAKLRQTGSLKPTEIIYRAEAFRRLEEYDHALADLDGLINQYPGNTRFKDARAKFWKTRAQLRWHWEEGQTEQALDEYAKALEDDPNDFEIYQLRSDCYLHLKKYELATADLSRAIELTTGNPDRLAEAYGQRAAAYSEMDDPDAAVADLTQAIKIASRETRARLLVERAGTYSQAGRHDAALEDISQAIELGDKREALLQRGAVHASQGNFESAAKDWEQVLDDPCSRDYDKTRAWTQLSALLVESTAEYARPVKALDRLGIGASEELELSAEYYSWQSAVSEWLKKIEETKGTEEAFQVARQIVESSHNDIVRVIGLRCLANLPYELRQDVDLAALLTGFHVDMNSLPAEILRDLGFASYILGDYPRAVTSYSRAIQLEPLHAVTYRWRAKCYAKIAYFEQAIADCSKAIDLTPEQELDSLGRLKREELYGIRGNLYRGMEEYLDAIADYTRAIELSPGNKISHWERAWAYEGMGDYRNAIADWERALKIDPNDEDVQGYLEEARQKLHDKRNQLG